MADKVKNYLGIDWGEKRIGLAMGDSETRIAIPYDVVNRLEDILRVINKEEIDMVLIGKPVKMSGANDNLTKEFEEFVKELSVKIKIPLEQVDERLTSKAADALNGGKRNKASRDSVAAMLILQTYLDKER